MASLLRRGLPAIVLAGTGGALLARFDHTEALTAGTDRATATAAPALTAPTTTTPATTAPSSTRSAAGAPTAPSTTAPATTRPSAAAPTVPSTTRPSVAEQPPATAGSCTGAEALGPVVQTRWGPVQVAAIVAHGTICEIRAVAVPSSHTRSTVINNRAVPILNDRALASQSAAFQTVTGATVTSEGYRSSLQAILNDAK